PYTPATGAWKLADDLCRLTAATPAAHPTCTVYTYPAHWLPGLNGYCRWRRPDDFPPESARPRDLSPPAKPTAGDGPASASQAAAPQTQARTGSAGGLEPLFARRLPAGKRGMDIVGALCGLVLFSPLFLFIAIVIKIVSPGPVFLRQERVGRLGRPFTLWKFRTMKVNADEALHK